MTLMLLLNIGFAMVTCTMLATVMWLAFRLAGGQFGENRDSAPEDEDLDRGSGGGGPGGPPRPDGRDPNPGAPTIWWPEFERQFAAYVELIADRRTVDTEATSG